MAEKESWQCRRGDNAISVSHHVQVHVCTSGSTHVCISVCMPGFFLGQFELACRASKLTCVRKTSSPEGRARWGGGGGVRGHTPPEIFEI